MGCWRQVGTPVELFPSLGRTWHGALVPQAAATAASRQDVDVVTVALLYTGRIKKVDKSAVNRSTSSLYNYRYYRC